MRGESGCKNLVSTYSLQCRVIRSVYDWFHLTAGASIGTFPSLLAGCYIEPTEDCLLGYTTHLNLRPIGPGGLFSHEVAWEQRVSKDSEYKLKYAFDQAQRLAAKYRYHYSDTSAVSFGASLAASAVGVGVHHSHQLADNMSVKVQRRSKRNTVDWR